MKARQINNYYIPEKSAFFNKFQYPTTKRSDDNFIIKFESLKVNGEMYK